MLDTVVILLNSSPIPKDLNILGLTYEERIEKGSRKAGFKNIIWAQEGPPKIETDAFLLLDAGVILTDKAWQKLAEWQPGEEVYARPSADAPLACIATKDREKVQRAIQHSRSFNEVLHGLAPDISATALLLRPYHWRQIADHATLNKAEKWMLRNLIKPNEGFMSRHFERKISLTVTSLLINTGITPNAMTIVSILIGLAGAICFIQAEKWYHISGALLFWLHSVLDGCDGEIARLKYLESRWGGILDFWGDNIVHSAVFSAIAWGLSIKEGASGPFLLLGALSVGGTLGSAGLVYLKTMAPKEEAGPLFTGVVETQGASQARKIADFLARRDFIYLVIFLAYIGHIEWFLWMGAIGAPAYLLALAYFHFKPEPTQVSQLLK